MRDGLKTLARDLVEKTLEKVKRIQLEKYHKAKNEADKLKIELNPKQVFHKAVLNCKPVLYLTPIKRGGVTYQVCFKFYKVSVVITTTRCNNTAE